MMISPSTRKSVNKMSAELPAGPKLVNAISLSLSERLAARSKELEPFRGMK